MSLDRVTLYTIGYQGRGGAAVVRKLRSAGVRRLVDVRHTPRSRNPDYSLMALFERLHKAGLSYEHFRELGNPPAIRDVWQADLQVGRRRYREMLGADGTEALNRLVKLALVEPTAILCREQDPQQCHRSIVADAVAERDQRFEIRHL